jgi:hypothetical protein
MTAKPITTAPRIRNNLARYRRAQAIHRVIIAITLLTLAAVIAATL